MSLQENAQPGTGEADSRIRERILSRAHTIIGDLVDRLPAAGRILATGRPPEAVALLDDLSDQFDLLRTIVTFLVEE